MWSSTDLILNNLCKILGKSASINIWLESILRFPTLGLDPSLFSLKDHMMQSGVVHLDQISNWDRQGLWRGWKMENIAASLIPSRDNLINKLIGCTPLAQSIEDRWGWNNSSFSVKEGYSHLLFNAQIPPKSSIWNKVWKTNAIPKVNFFCLLLAHKRILTAENL